MARIRFFENGVLKRILALSNGKLKILDSNENVVKDLEAEVKKYLIQTKAIQTVGEDEYHYYDVTDLNTGETTEHEAFNNPLTVNLDNDAVIFVEDHPTEGGTDNSTVIININSGLSGKYVLILKATTKSYVSLQDNGSEVLYLSKADYGVIFAIHDGTKLHAIKLVPSSGGAA